MQPHYIESWIKVDHTNAECVTTRILVCIMGYTKQFAILVHWKSGAYIRIKTDYTDIGLLWYLILFSFNYFPLISKHYSNICHLLANICRTLLKQKEMLLWFVNKEPIAMFTLKLNDPRYVVTQANQWVNVHSVCLLFCFIFNKALKELATPF